MRAIVSAPDLRRAAHGLVESANHPQTNARWETGVSFTPRGCNVVFGHSPSCPNGEWSNFQECALVTADPWIIESALVWSTVDLAANPKGLLTDAVDIGTSAVLERLTSSGLSAVTVGTAINPPAVTTTVVTGGIKGRAAGTLPPTLAGVVHLNAGPFTADSAVGHVEAKLLDAADHIGQAGTLLMSPITAATARDSICLHDGQLYTRATDSLVIVGNFAPTSTVYGVAGEVDVYLSDIEVTETYERKTNEIVLRAERYALAVWATCATFGATVGP